MFCSLLYLIPTPQAFGQHLALEKGKNGITTVKKIKLFIYTEYMVVNVENPKEYRGIRINESLGRLLDTKINFS